MSVGSLCIIIVIQNKLKMLKTLSIISCIILMTLSISAQDQWDLEKCIVYAWENSLAINQLGYNYQSEKINRKLAQQARYPDLRGSGGMQLNFGRSLDPTTDAFSTQSFFSNSYSLSSGVTLFNGFRIRNQLKQSGLNLDAAEKDIDQIKMDIALDVASAYLSALLAQENMNTFKNSIELSQEQLSQIDKLIAAGARPLNERLDILAQLSLNEQDFISAQNSLNISLLNLKQIMNYDVEKELQLVIPDENIVTLFSDPDKLSFQEVYQVAVQNQPNIEAGKIRIMSSEMSVDIAKSALYPVVFAGGSLGTNYSNKGLRVDEFQQTVNNTPVTIDGQAAIIGFPSTNAITSKNPYFNQIDENLAYGVGINFNLPIYNNYIGKSGVEQAKLNVLRAKNQNEQQLQLLKTTVQQSLAEAQTAKKALEVSKTTVEAQEAAFANAEKRFELGAINTFDYIQAKNQYDSASIRAVIAKYDYIFKVKILDFYLGKPLTL